jgi:hypothetical protein
MHFVSHNIALLRFLYAPFRAAFQYSSSLSVELSIELRRNVTRHRHVRKRWTRREPRARLFPTYLHFLWCIHRLVFHACFHILYKITMTILLDDKQEMADTISRDGFFNHGRSGLYVRLDGVHAHHRCNDKSLHKLLTYTPCAGPVLTKKGAPEKRQLTPHKDESVHFYVAQLAHYGLKPLKTKDPAKRNLLAAFKGGNTLAVSPSWSLRRLSYVLLRLTSQ